LQFRKTRPTFITNPESFLEPDLQNMFSLCYYTSPNTLIPLGWNTIDEDKPYPTLASRQPELSDDGSSHGPAGSESGNEDDAIPRNNFSSTTRMNEEESDASEDELALPAQNVGILDFLPTLIILSQVRLLSYI